MPQFTFTWKPRRLALAPTRATRVVRRGGPPPAEPVNAEPDGAGGYRVPVYANGVLVGYMPVTPA